MLFIKTEDMLHVAQRLEPLGLRFVFIGGGILGFLINDPAVPTVRGTRDIDIVLEALAVSGYERLEAQLRTAGFQHDMSDGAPRCRWLLNGVKVDILSARDDFSGGNARWLAETVAAPMPVTLKGKELFVASAPCFLALKLEAFAGRGNNDHIGSRDMDDIVTVIDGRLMICEEVAAADPAVRRFVAAGFDRLLNDHSFHLSLPGHLLPDPASQKRKAFILDRMQQIAAMNS